MAEITHIPQELLDALKVQLAGEIKTQLVEELKDEKVRAQEKLNKRREIEKEARDAYVTKMKESAEPWVDVIGQTQDEQGVRTELDWNDAFVDYLRKNGITGVDDDQMVQKWLALLLRDVADDLDGSNNAVGRSQSEFE